MARHRIARRANARAVLQACSRMSEGCEMTHLQADNSTSAEYGMTGRSRRTPVIPHHSAHREDIRLRRKRDRRHANHRRGGYCHHAVGHHRGIGNRSDYLDLGHWLVVPDQFPPVDHRWRSHDGFGFGATLHADWYSDLAGCCHRPFGVRQHHTGAQCSAVDD